MSPFQAQYPLSPRKFWKKFIEKLFLVGLPWLVITGASVLLASDAAAKDVADMMYSIVLILTVVAAAILALYAWYLKVYIRRYYYDAGDNFITIKKGVFAPTEIHVLYQKIQDVYVDQDILDRIMGLYDVHIASATASSGIEAHIDGVEHDSAEAMKNILLGKIQGSGPIANTSLEQPAAPPSTPTAVAFSEDISTKTYPLGTRWVIYQLIVGLFSTTFMTLAVYFWIFYSNEDEGVSLIDMWGLPSNIWMPILAVMLVIHIAWVFLWRATYSFAFLPEYIQMRSGVIARSEVHVPYRAVQDVTVSQGIIERLFGLATLNIANAAQGQVIGRNVVKQTGVQIPGQTPEKAEHMASIIRGITVTKNSAQTGL